MCEEYVEQEAIPPQIICRGGQMLKMFNIPIEID